MAERSGSARRHEAELKLRAAEANLSRAEDLRGQLQTQLGSLKRQARQASRYRNLSGAIRAAEAELLSISRARVERDRAAAEIALQEAEASAIEAAAEAESDDRLAAEARLRGISLDPSVEQGAVLRARQSETDNNHVA